MGVDVADVNGDGRWDVFVTNLNLETNTLYLGRSFGFVDATSSAGLFGPSLPVVGFGTHFLDIDNDTDADLFVANGHVLDNSERLGGTTWRQPDHLYLNDGRGVFEPLPADVTGPLSKPRVGRGSAVVDIDADGRLDLAVSYQTEAARLFANRSTPASWVAFDGAGPVGTLVTVVADGRLQSREARSASGYQSSSSPRLHFGLALSDRVDVLVVRGSEGRMRRFEALPADVIYRLAP